ncbi:MAG: dephospho-CoA kinase [Bacillota bacterium]
MEKSKNIIAITGNIGSGKSTVMAMLEKRGYKTLSADKFTQNAYLVAQEKLIHAFGDGIIESGEISRKNLSQVAFSSEKNLQKLNQIMHPIIFDMIFESCQSQGANFVEVPLLFESGMENYFSQVWIILASDQNKIARASVRDSVSKTEIEKRLSFQKNHEENLENLHIIIENNGDIANLENQVELGLKNL